MPRGARIDAAGVLHHVWARGIERRRIFLHDGDREDFIERLEKTCEKNGARIYAWCLMPNHFHLAIRTGEQPLAKTMRGVLTGYAMYFNRQHRRHGHLFQNRYKSTVVDEEQYFLALVRYIHLNPVRARMVEAVDSLQTYPWTGHSVLMGKKKYAIQDIDAVLRRFGSRAGAARKGLAEFMQMNEAKNETKTFEGGGLRRSAGGVKKLLEFGQNEKWAYDERILGDSSFVELVLKVSEKQKPHHVLSPGERWVAFDKVSQRLCEKFEVGRSELYGGSRRRAVSEVRQLLSYAGCYNLGLSAAEVGRTLGVSRQGISKNVAKAVEVWEELDWLIELSD